MRFREIIWLNIILIVAFFSQTAFGQTELITPLELNKSIERKIEGITQKHNYRIQLTEGQYARVAIEQTEVDVLATVFGANEKPIIVFDDELRCGQNEIIEFVAVQNGNYRIEVKTKSKAWSGIYKIRLEELSEETKQNRAKFEIETLIAQAEDATKNEKYDEAITLFKSALESAEKQFAPYLIGRVLNGLTLATNNKGDYATVQNLLERTAGNEKKLGANHPLTAQTLFLQGQYFRSIGDRAGAERSWRNALTAYENALDKEHPALFDTLLKLSGLHISLNDYDTAIGYLERAEKIIEKHYGGDDKLMAGVVNNLGVVYMSKENYDEAEKYFLRTMAIGEKAGESQRYNYSLTMQNLAAIYRAKKDYRRALESYQKVLKMREAILGGEHQQVAWALYGIANIYIETGELAKAIVTLERAREIAEKSVGFYRDLTTVIIGDTARVLAAQGEAEKAIAYQQIHDERYERFFTSELTIGSERQKLLSVTRLVRLTSSTISLHLNAAQTNQVAANLAALVILQRKGRVFDALADNLAAIRGRANDNDRRLLDRLSEKNTEIAKLTLGKPAKMPNAEFQKQLAELERQKEQIEIEIGDRNAQFAIRTPIFSLEAIKAEIPADAALIELSVYVPFYFKKEAANDGDSTHRYAAYIITKEGEVKGIDLGAKKVIDSLIDDLRKALRDPKRNDVKKLARAADEKIMQPIRSILGETKKLLISPDGDLNLIPFESLIDEKGKYLIENYQFTYLTSGRDLLRLRANKTSKNKSVILANPNFGQPNAEQFSKFNANDLKSKRSVTAGKTLAETYFAPLGATMLEGRAIQELFPESEFLSGAQATESAIKNLNAPRFLHIASHGFFLQDADSQKNVENPLLRSGIALTGANQRKSVADNDGILTALEASGLNLWGTKLVVLSACDTGLGDVKNGEGVYGLRRAFTLAGTETLMMSLWEVSDVVTRELMTNYYKNLKIGFGRGESLRQVQLQMLKKKGREHPFYWAAFIQSGEWGNLEGKR